jgi:hypothetical protein
VPLASDNMNRNKRPRGRPPKLEIDRLVMESFRCFLPLKMKLYRYCEQHNMTVSEAICQAVEMFLDAKLFQGEFKL